MTAATSKSPEKRPGGPWRIPGNRDMLVRIFPFEPARSNYLINVSPHYGYAYFETPKVACSSIKRALQLAECARTGGTPPQNVHDKSGSPLSSPCDLDESLDAVLEGDAYFRFAFVRNPFSRVLSAYLDKLVQNDWERRRLLPTLGFRPDARPSFLEFLERIEPQNTADKDIHWTPQCDLLGWDRLTLHFVGRFENFADDFSQIGQKIFGDASRKYVSARVDGHQTRARSRIAELIGPQESRLINKIYDRDFALYGYSRDPFFASTS